MVSYDLPSPSLSLTAPDKYLRGDRRSCSIARFHCHQRRLFYLLHDLGGPSSPCKSLLSHHNAHTCTHIHTHTPLCLRNPSAFSAMTVVWFITMSVSRLCLLTRQASGNWRGWSLCIHIAIQCLGNTWTCCRCMSLRKVQSPHPARQRNGECVRE